MDKIDLGNLKFFSNDGVRSLKPYVSVDKHGRIYISEGAKEVMNIHDEELPISLYVGYDKINKRIGLARSGELQIEGIKPFKFNGKRLYASVRSFLMANRILPDDGTVKYEYVGNSEGVFVFQLEESGAQKEEEGAN